MRRGELIDSACELCRNLATVILTVWVCSVSPRAEGTNSIIPALEKNRTGETQATTFVGGKGVEDRFPTPEESLNRLTTLDDRHGLAIGDRISFRILEDEEEPRPVSVTDSGDLELPYLGRFPAEGKNCRQLATEVKAALEKEYYYQATVIIAVDTMARTRGRVYLVGPVRSPGPQEIPSDEVLTLSRAILRAGGFSDFADAKSVRITRKAQGQERQIIVNVADILNKGKTAADVSLEPGDLIYVPERIVRF